MIKCPSTDKKVPKKFLSHKSKEKASKNPPLLPQTHTQESLINTPSSKKTQKQKHKFDRSSPKKRKEKETKPGQNPQPTLPTTNRKKQTPTNTAHYKSHTQTKTGEEALLASATEEMMLRE